MSGVVSTAGVSLLFEINDKKIRIQIWDTAGQERFRSISLNYFRGVQGVIFVFDLTTELYSDDIDDLASDYFKYHYKKEEQNFTRYRIINYKRR